MRPLSHCALLPVSKTERHQRAHHYVEMVSLRGFEHAYPTTLFWRHAPTRLAAAAFAHDIANDLPHPRNADAQLSELYIQLK